MAGSSCGRAPATAWFTRCRADLRNNLYGGGDTPPPFFFWRVIAFAYGLSMVGIRIFKNKKDDFNV